MNRCATIATIYFCLLASIYSDSIKSFDNEQAWQTYILKMTPKEYSEMKNLTREEAKEKFKTEEDLKKHMEKWGRRGRFFIPLKVVDETGAAVSDVTVDVTKLIGGFFKTNYEYLRSEKQRGFLVVEVNGCETVTIRLSFQNSYPTYKQRLYYLNIPRDYYTIKGDTVVGFPLAVGFRRMGDLLKLRKIDEVQFQLKNNKSNVFSLETFKMEEEANEMSGPRFTIVYKRDPNGKILLKQYPSVSYDWVLGSDGTYKQTKRIRNTPLHYDGFEHVEFTMMSKNPEDGIILYDDEILPLIPTEPVAPPGGYQKGFVMPFSSISREFRFFFRAGGRYGKGIISYHCGGNHVIKELFINTEQDPNKKRNLWTKEEPCL